MAFGQASLPDAACTQYNAAQCIKIIIPYRRQFHLMGNINIDPLLLGQAVGFRTGRVAMRRRRQHQPYIAPAVHWAAASQKTPVITNFDAAGRRLGLSAATPTIQSGISRYQQQWLLSCVCLVLLKPAWAATHKIYMAKFTI